jgi:hypothetical protein
MTADTLITTILAHAFTKAEVHRHLWLVRTYLERHWFGGVNGGTLEDFYAHEGAGDRERAIASALSGDMTSLTKETMYPVLDAAQEKIQSLPFLSVSTPMAADDATVVRIGTWLRKNVHDTIVIDIVTDPNVVGGCAFAYRGYRHDFGLHRSMIKNREKIRGILHDYADKAAG